MRSESPTFDKAIEFVEKIQTDSMDYAPGEFELVNELSRSPWPTYLGVEIEKKPFIFMLPRKCASNSVKEALLQMGAVGHKHFTREQMLNMVMVPKIATVRHPVDRLVSSWKHGTQRDQGYYMLNGLYAWMPWDEFLDLVCTTWNDAVANYHFRSYSLELLDLGFAPSHIVRLETLEADWAQLTRKFDWPKAKFRQLNATKKTEVTVTKDQLKRLAIRYEADAFNFCYDILSWEP